MYLAIDTATETAGLALLREDGSLEAERSWHAGRNHTTELHPGIHDLLKQANLAPSDLTGLVVAIGPGSFTGIRIGMATAKGLSMGLNIPLVGVETLAIAAYPFIETGRTVWAVVGAGRGQVSVAAFQRHDETDGETNPIKAVDEHILLPDELCDAMAQDRSGTPLLCGEVPETLETLARERFGDGIVIPPETDRVRRAGNLALLGWRRLRHGDTDDPLTLEPLYLRPPAAVENLQRSK